MQEIFGQRLCPVFDLARHDFSKIEIEIEEPGMKIPPAWVSIFLSIAMLLAGEHFHIWRVYGIN